jgi:hypothetical protein
MVLKVYLTKEQYERYRKCAELEHRSISNFAEYAMKRRADTQKTSGIHKAKKTTSGDDTP